MDNKDEPRSSQQLEDLSGELKEAVKSLKNDISGFHDDMTGKLEAQGTFNREQREQIKGVIEQQSELTARLNNTEQELAAAKNGGNGPTLAPKSMGQLVAGNDEFMEGVKSLQGRKGSFAMEFDMPRNAITSLTEAAGGAAVDDMRLPGIVPGATRRMTMRDLLGSGMTTQTNSVEFVRETGFTNNAAPTSETTTKPESNITFELVQAPIVTIPHWIHASKQILADAPMMQSYIDQRLRYGLAFREEVQFLTGSGVGININGINTQATDYAAPSGASVTSEQDLDRIGLALLQVEVAEYFADGIVLNSVDWWNIKLMKDSELRYLFTNPQNGTDPRLWGLPTVGSNSQTQGEFTVGAFGMGAQIWDREGVTVQVSTEDNDNFTTNMCTLLAEQRTTLTVYRTESFVNGSLVSAS